LHTIKRKESKNVKKRKTYSYQTNLGFLQPCQYQVVNTVCSQRRGSDADCHWVVRRLSATTEHPPSTTR